MCFSFPDFSKFEGHANKFNVHYLLRDVLLYFILLTFIEPYNYIKFPGLYVLFGNGFSVALYSLFFYF